MPGMVRGDAEQTGHARKTAAENFRIPEIYELPGILPGLITDMLANPNRRWAHRTETSTYRSAIHMAVLQSTDASALTPIWQQLGDASRDTDLPIASRLGATFLASSMKAITDLPARKKHYGFYLVSNSNPNPHNTEGAIPVSDEYVDTTSVIDFADALTNGDPETQIRTLTSYDALKTGSLYNMSFTIIHYDYLHGIVDQVAEEERGRIYANPKTGELLLHGALNDAPVTTRYPIWYATIARQQTNRDGSSAVQYFRSQPEIQQAFWDEFTSPREANRGPDRPALDFTTSLLVSHPAEARTLLETIPLEDLDRQQKRRLLRQIAACAARAHADLADSPEAPEQTAHIRNALTALAERAEIPGLLGKITEVLADTAEGIVTINPQYEARVVRQSEEPLYVSRWQQPDAREHAEKKTDTRLNLQPGITEIFPDWHGHAIQIPQEEDTSKLLDHLHNKFKKSGISEKTISQRIFEMRRRDIQAGSMPIVIPELLPEDNPVSKLADAGITAIVPDDTGYDFTVLIDAQKAGIAIEGGQMLALMGQIGDLSGAKDISFIGQTGTNAFTDLLGGAALLARRPVVPEMLNGQERGGVHAAVNSWNRTGKRPQLIFDENELYPKGETVLYLIGKKTVKLQTIAA